MKHSKQDEELANIGTRPFPTKAPNPETLEAIREGDAFLATGKSGRFDNGADLINAALKAPEVEIVQSLMKQPFQKFRSYWNNSIHITLRLSSYLYSNSIIKEAAMLWSYVQLDDGTQFAYSETREDGTVRVAVERPVDFGFDHAECFLPAVEWFNVEGFSADDLNFLTEFVRTNAPFIFELAERQKAGPAVA